MGREKRGPEKSPGRGKNMTKIYCKNKFIFEKKRNVSLRRRYWA